VVANLVVLYTRAFASAQRVEAVLATEPVIRESLNTNDTEEASQIVHMEEHAYLHQAINTHQPVTLQERANIPETPALEFENVRFAYTIHADPVFDPISFQIMPGERIGLIGATGSGKSTLARLALRLLEADAGTIRLFGQDIRSLSFAELHQQIGLAQQKALLMSGTLAENLRMGHPDADGDILHGMLYLAAADDITAELAQGLESPVSRGGTNFSGGQRQRLAIARALTADPRILILDDCFSALDYLTEAKLRQRLYSLTPQKTLILISQRVSSIRTCDRIMVLDDGNIVGFGTHQALLADCAIYREIYRTQFPEGVTDRAP
jgi:ATP-binding cassette subfamily B multidrug efflux pump